MRSKIKIKSLNFMRGRTFLNKFVIIDEAQNLTPKQMKTLITRAGPGTKIVCLGNLAQIDTPYLTEGSSGLTYAVDRFKGWAHSGHVTLARGERSRLADFASEVLWCAVRADHRVEPVGAERGAQVEGDDQAPEIAVVAGRIATAGDVGEAGRKARAGERAERRRALPSRPRAPSARATRWCRAPGRRRRAAAG